MNFGKCKCSCFILLITCIVVYANPINDGELLRTKREPGKILNSLLGNNFFGNGHHGGHGGYGNYGGGGGASAASASASAASSGLGGAASSASANSQSATYSFGPFSASFSSSQSQAGSQAGGYGQGPSHGGLYNDYDYK